MIKLKFLIPFLLLLLNCTHPESKDFGKQKLQLKNEKLISPQNVTCKVIGVKDGDTIVLLIAGAEQTVRLAHIDCPEKKQAFGSKAKQFVSDLCFGTNVSVIFNEKKKYDRNKRLIAEVILPNGKTLNKELVKNGLAWHFKKYSDDEDYSQLEIEAQNNKIGIWSELNPIAPWDWRKFKKK